MYRDDLEAAIRRASDLQRELEAQSSQKQHDATRIQSLEMQLDAARKELARLSQDSHHQQAAFAAVGRDYQPSNATTALVLGIVSIVFCSLAGPFAWHYGNVELDRIERGLVNPLKRSEASAGRILGIIGTTFLLLTFGFILFLVALV